MVVTLASVTSGETRAESGPGARFGVVRILVVDDAVDLSEAVARDCVARVTPSISLMTVSKR